MDVLDGARQLHRFELLIVVGEVAGNHREVEPGQDGARRLALEQEAKALPDKVFDVGDLCASAPPFEVGLRDPDRMPRALAGVLNLDVATPGITILAASHLDHRAKLSHDLSHTPVRLN